MVSITPLLGGHSHLQVGNELPHSDFLCNLLVQALAVEHHALQDGQGALQDGHVHHGLTHVPCNLKPQQAAGQLLPTQETLWRVGQAQKGGHCALRQYSASQSLLLFLGDA